MRTPNLLHTFPTDADLKRAARQFNNLFVHLQQGSDTQIKGSLRKFHDYSTRSSVVKGQGFHCDGTVYRTETILASDTPVIGAGARKNWDIGLQSRNLKISKPHLPIHIEHSIPINVLAKYLRTEACQKFAHSKRRLLQFVFFNSVLCCVSKNVDGIDEQKICDQNSRTAHDDFAKGTELDRILPFRRYIGVSPQIRVYRLNFDNPNTWVPIELESWRLNDHRAYLEGAFAETFSTLLSMVLGDELIQGPQKVNQLHRGGNPHNHNDG